MTIDSTTSVSLKRDEILVVEDDEVSARIIESTLTDSGFLVTRFVDGETALELIQQAPNRFRCILLDCMLPGIDGMEVLRRLKANKELNHIPVIIETALDDAENIRTGFTHGAFSYLTKPLKLNLLRSMVHAALDRYHVNISSVEERQRLQRSLDLLDFGKFHCRTLDEAQKLANTLSMACPEPDRVASGLLELLINAIEHGTLGITYEDKTRLVLSESWRDEVERRLGMDCYIGRNVMVDLERFPNEMVFTICDDGPGFDYQCYLDFDAERALHPHGRGIAMACTFNLDDVEFLGNGNTVRVRVKTAAT